jgi:hypothetical protein
VSAPEFVVHRDPGVVWRVGRVPDPWAWTDWKYAKDQGRFDGRWDDPDGQFRTAYACSNLYACLLEVLAKFRPHLTATAVLEAISADPLDDLEFPTVYGRIDRNWLDEHRASTAYLRGAYCAIAHSQSVAALRPAFLALAIESGAADFDVSVLKNPIPRQLTRAIAQRLYEELDPASGINLVDGIEFTSRHGDDLPMWAVFERPGQPEISPLLDEVSDVELSAETPDLVGAFEL